MTEVSASLLEHTARNRELLTPRVLRLRRVRILLYFARVIFHFLWGDWLLKWRPLRMFRTPWIPRWQIESKEYKKAALEFGGLWVKLGQFLSTRVDVLPIEITRELESLRDEVPAIRGEVVIAQIETDLGSALGEKFSWVSLDPIGSASLAQVHRARTVTGDPVVVKVLRPGIRETIRVDMSLLRKLSRLLKFVKFIKQRADVDAIVREFESVTINELDLRLEAKNAERFSQDFAADPNVVAPRIYKDESSTNLLTMEDVSYIRIDDVGALTLVGIDPKAVARKVYNIYLTQFFVTYHIHADPHPGNIFVRPLPTVTEMADHPIGWSGFEPGKFVPHAAGRQFQIAVVDFGMVVEVPPALREGMREFAVGLGTRDARRILDSYGRLGILMPNANLDEIEEMLQAQLNEFWGTFLGQMRESDLSGPAAEAFIQKYGGLMAAAPFQFRSEMLFTTRAMGILSGLTYSLDPTFDPWKETAPFAQRLIQEDITNAVRNSFADIVAGRAPSTLGPLLRLLPITQPRRPRTVIVDKAQAEEMRRLRRSVHRLTSVVLVIGIFAVGFLLEAKGIKVSHLVLLPWPKENLQQWLIELFGISLLIALLRRGF